MSNPAGRPPWSSEKFNDAFWSKCEKTVGCWTWQHRTSGSGYGRIKRHRKEMPAHKYAWEITFGKVPDGLLVLHRCDNPLCIRPDHLFLGTQSDNITDCAKKGRHPKSKLTADQVREIRKLRSEGIFAKDIAPRFGVSLGTIYHACDGRSYRWVEGESA